MMWFPPGSSVTLCPAGMVNPPFFSFICVDPLWGSFVVSCSWTDSAVP